MPRKTIPQPWHSFLTELTAGATEELILPCLGGFVVTLLYGLERPTADVDVLAIFPSAAGPELLARAGKNSPLHRRYGLYLDLVTVVTLPEDYDQRLTEMFPAAIPNLRLLALDPYDLALSKLERNGQRDRDDVKHLARVAPFDLDLLQERYERELRPYLGVPEREDLTLRLWREMLAEASTDGPAA